MNRLNWWSDMVFRRPFNVARIIHNVRAAYPRANASGGCKKGAAQYGTLAGQTGMSDTGRLIDALAQFLAGLEVRNVFFRHVHFIARFRVAPLPRGAVV